MLYRHGDVLIALVHTLPNAAVPRPGTVLARGELTGHSHRFAQAEGVQLYQAGADLYAEVRSGDARLIHDEHHAIALPAGLYRVWMQREYSPQAIRRVLD